MTEEQELAGYKQLRCECCGAVYKVMKGRPPKRMICKPCASAEAEIGAQLVGTPMPTEEWLNEVFSFVRRSFISGSTDRATKPPTFTPHVYNSAGRCYYCGKNLGTVFAGYCRSCQTNRFDNIHAMTGKTNGWDKTAFHNVQVPYGWRGKPVAGCNSAIGRHNGA